MYYEVSIAMSDSTNGGMFVLQVCALRCWTVFRLYCKFLKLLHIMYMVTASTDVTIKCFSNIARRTQRCHNGHKFVGLKTLL